MAYDYERQIEEIVNYFKSHETKREDYLIGVEFEHFVIYKDTLETVSYYGENGVGETLKDLEKLGYKAEYEGDYVLGANKGKKVITLEPGSQLELSIHANINLRELEEEYLEFLDDIVPLLRDKGQELIAVGYHPVTKIDDIKLLPKERYDYMFDYFKTRGTHAHNMMKGTSALQVSLDYSSEEDYNKKFRIGNALSPVLYGLFENAYYFEGEESKKHNIRCHIWENCDTDRSGVAKNGLDKDFGYRKYAEYILNYPPIFIMDDEGNAEYTKKMRVRDLFDPDNYTEKELEHILTMFFPDVRTKNFVEIRMMDSIPYPLNFSVVALIKGLFYNQENIDELTEYISDISMDDVDQAKREMRVYGLKTKLNGETLLDIGKYLYEISKRGLEDEEIDMLEPLKELLDGGKSPYDITKSKADEGIRESIEWCILKDSEGR